MAERDIVVIGASAGGVEAVAALAGALPRDLAAAVFVVVHFPAHATSVLPRIISRRGGLRAEHAVDGAPVKPGCVTWLRPTATCWWRAGTCGWCGVRARTTPARR